MYGLFGLAPKEVILGATPSARHQSLLSFYLQDLEVGAETVRDIIVADIRVSLSLGAVRQAADLLVVLREFLSEYPEAQLAPRPYAPPTEALSRPMAPARRGRHVRSLLLDQPSREAATKH